MYGTVGRMRVKPGSESQLNEQMRMFEEATPPGVKATYVYRMDKNPNEFLIATVWESKEAYTANAQSPEQHARYQEYMKLMTAEPEWNDGEIVYAKTY